MQYTKINANAALFFNVREEANTNYELQSTAG